MPILPGAPATADFDDPLGLMSDCHRRIEHFLAVLRHVARRLPADLEPRERDALAGALRYFREAAPLHAADEEESLAPRLFSLDDPEVVAFHGRWLELEADHRRKEQLLPVVLTAGEALLRRRSVDDVEFRDTVDALAAIYGPHIATEDDVLFPMARRLLGAEAKAEITREMAARRGVGWRRR